MIVQVQNSPYTPNLDSGETHDCVSAALSTLIKPRFLVKHKIVQVQHFPYWLNPEFLVQHMSAELTILSKPRFWWNTGLCKCSTRHTYQPQIFSKTNDCANTKLFIQTRPRFFVKNKIVKMQLSRYSPDTDYLVKHMIVPG